MFELIPEGEREEDRARQGLSLEKEHEAGPSLAHRRKWDKASMAGSQGVREQVRWEEVRPGAGDR